MRVQDTSNRGQVMKIQNVNENTFEADFTYTASPSSGTIMIIFKVIA